MASAPNASGMEFEVFLSFRGSDTRDNFTSCLYHNMTEKGIRVFKDDKELQVGEKIDELFKALDDSQIYIPIFSEDFASSAWCLCEVARMVDRTLESDGKKEILPLFFDVTPEDVKSSTGLYSNALSKLEKEKVKYGHEEEKEKYDPDEVKRWRDALREVATRAGWKREGKEYGELIGSIVREVQLKLKVKNRSLPDHLVKVDDEEVIEELLDVDSDGVRFVIIHGTGGIGKSTLAKVIFNKLLSKFGYSSFLEDVQSHRLLDMQKKLLSDTLGATSIDGIRDTNDGINRIRKGLSEKKVMVVVDNVNDKEQLKNIAGSYKWFGSGSRIIITVRDKRTIPYRTMLDEDNQTGSSYCRYHQVEEMPLDRAINLFSKHAFGSDTPPKDWDNFSIEVVSSIGRLPLTLEVVGSLFATTDRSEWHETFKDLEQVPCEEVRKTLMISLNKLDLRKIEIFLDIACFCIGKDKTHVYYMWDDCGYSPRRAIDDLLLMSLIKIDKNNEFWMHDEIRDLGRYIVKEENLGDAGKRRWVWIDENTLDVLTSNKKKKAVQALSLGIDHDFTPEEIACLPKLRFLEGERLDFVGDFKNLLHSLMWLSWHDCPPNFLVTNLHLVNLVVLNLSRSKITDDWGGWRQMKMAKKLKILDLTQCYRLTKTPDLSMFHMLEKLILAGCKNLSTIDSSIGKLKLLSTLNINKCASLKGLPEEIGSLECLSEIIIPFSNNQFKFPETLGNLKSLTKFAIQKHGGINQLPCSIGRLNITHLVLTCCYRLHELPDSIGELESLIKLDLCGSAISILPYSIGRLTSLTHLNLSECRNLHELPNSIGELESLVELNLRRSEISILPNSIGRLKNLKHLLLADCSNLHELPNSLGELESLVKLNLRLSKISILPYSIGRLKNLKHLLLEGCSNLHELPNSIGELKALVELDLEYTWISFLPDSIKNLKRLKVLKMARTKIRTIPSALGGVETLEELDASFCQHLTDEIPWEMWSLTRLRILNLFETPISTVPKKISGFSSLQMLKVTSYRLCQLPELPSSLKCLVVKAAYFPVLPNLSNLVHLDHLEVCRTHAIITFWSANEVISPWKDARSIHQLARSLSTLILGWIPQLPDFSNFKSLVVLSISGCPLPHFPVLKYLERLRELMISSCELLESTPDLSCLKSLQKLELGAIIKLAEIPGLGEVESLKFLHITMCNMIKQLPNLSKLKNLQSLVLEHCEKLRAIEGLKELNSLKKVEIKHCVSLERLPDVPASTKLETNWMPPEAAEHTIQSTMPGKRLRLWEFWDE